MVDKPWIPGIHHQIPNPPKSNRCDSDEDGLQDERNDGYHAVCSSDRGDRKSVTQRPKQERHGQYPGNDWIHMVRNGVER